MVKKASKKEAQYRQRPNKGAKCAGCTMFRKPKGCTAVTGVVAPTGWCKYFEAKGEQHLDEGGQVQPQPTGGPDTSSAPVGPPMDISPPPTKDDVEPGNKIPDQRDMYDKWSKDFNSLPEGLHTGWDPGQGPPVQNISGAADKFNDTPARTHIEQGMPIKDYAQGGKVEGEEDWMHIVHHPEHYFGEGGEVDDELPEELQVLPEHLQGPAEDDEPHAETWTDDEPPEEKQRQYAQAPSPTKQDSVTYDDGEPQRMADTNLGAPAAPGEVPTEHVTGANTDATDRSTALAHTVARSAATGLLSLPGVVAGGTWGAGLGSPLGPVGSAVGGFIGAGVGGIVMSPAATAARDWALDMLGLDSPEQRQAEQEKVGGTLAGQAAEIGGSLIGGSVRGAAKTLAGAIGERAAMAGGMGAINVGQQAMEKPDIDWGEAAMAAGAGAAVPGLNRVGRAFAAPGHWIAGRPNVGHTPESAADVHEATDGTSEDVKVSKGVAQEQSAPREDRAQPAATLSVVGDQGNTGRFAKRLQGITSPEITEGQIEPPVIAALKEALGGSEEPAPTFGKRQYDPERIKQAQGEEAIQRAREAWQNPPKPETEPEEVPPTVLPPESSGKVTDALADRETFGQRPEPVAPPEGLAQGNAAWMRPQGEAEPTPWARQPVPGDQPAIKAPPSGDETVDRLLQHPNVQKAMSADWRNLVQEGDRVPYLAGALNDGSGRFAVDPAVPEVLQVKRADGKGTINLPAKKLYGIHENIETEYIKDQIAKLGREPTEEEKGRFYDEGHKIARRVEESLVEAVGGDVHDYNRIGAELEAQARQPLKPGEKTPENLYRDPYAGDPKAQHELDIGGTQPELAERTTNSPNLVQQGQTQNAPSATARVQAISQGRSAAAQPPAGNVPRTPGGGNNPPGGPPISPPPGGGRWTPPGPRPIPQRQQGQPTGLYGAGALPKPYRNVDQKGMPWVATDLPYHEGSPGRGPARSLADRQKEKDNEYVNMATNVRNNFWRKASTDKLGLENLSNAWDKNDLNSLPQKDRAEWDRNYQPLVDATAKLRENMKDWYRQRGFSEEQIAKRLGDDTENGMMRIREDFQNMHEWQALQNMDSILGQQTSRRPQYIDRIQPREFVALESDQTGDRRVISVHNDGKGFTEWNNRNNIKTVDHSDFNRQVGQTWDGTKENPPSNQTYKVRDATMAEIEQHGLDHNDKPLKYLRDPRASAYLQFMSHFRAAQDMQMIEGIPNDPRLKDLMAKAGDVRHMPDGWVKLNSDPFRSEHWYADPALARVLDMYNRPGIQDDRFNGPRKLGRMLQNTMFWQFLKHPMNVVPHWFENAGFDLIPGNVKGNARILASIPLGVKELIAPGRITERLMDHPGTLMYQNTIADKTNRAIKALGDAAMQTNMPLWRQLAAKAGVPVKVLLKGWWQLSRENTWAMGDAMGLAAHIQNAMKVANWNPLQGKFDINKLSEAQIEQVINMTNKTVPPYRIPESQLGSPLLSTLQSEQGIFSFGPYHHAITNTFGNILKAVSPPGNGVDLKTRWDSVGKAFGLAVFMYMIHPLFDKIAKWGTGNPDATAWQAGPPALLHLLTQFGEGASKGIEATHHLFMENPLLKATLEAFYTNEDWKGDHVFEPHHSRQALSAITGREDGDWRAIPKVVGEGVSHFASQAISPIGSAMRYMASPQGAASALRDDFLGFKQPSPTADFWKNKTLRDDAKKAQKRENRTKSPIEQFFFGLSHMGEE